MVYRRPRGLVISRLVRAPRAALWRAWTDSEMPRQRWCPKSRTTEVKAFDRRPSGAFHTFMQGPDGGNWRPCATWLAMTAIITMADEGEGTRCVATVMHRDAATCERHEQMGFHQGCNLCIDPLEACAAALWRARTTTCRVRRGA